MPYLSTICTTTSQAKLTKVSLAAHFGDEVEMDIFYLWSKPFVLLIDVATRYKVAYHTKSRETEELLRGLLHHWIRYFGPMRVLTSDQESGLMSPSAAVEFERLNIERNPKAPPRAKQASSAPEQASLSVTSAS